MPSLNGRTIALLESRKSVELADLVRRFGGTPIAAPAVREVARLDDFNLFLDGITAGRFTVAVFLTGVGAATLLREAERRGRLDEAIDGLRRIRVACRGPKPLAALKRYGVQPSITTAKPHTSHELIDALAALDLRGAGVLLAHYGERNDAIAGALRGRGARVEEVCPYVWAMPEDVAPMTKVVDEAIARRIDAVLFTTQIQCRHLFQIAVDMNKVDALRAALEADVVVAAIGPVCAEALRQLGVRPDVIPGAGNMASLVTAVADYFELTGRADETKELGS